MAQVVECLLSKHEALSSNPTTRAGEEEGMAQVAGHLSSKCEALSSANTNPKTKI
jgi:hypothetical protein